MGQEAEREGKTMGVSLTLDSIRKNKQSKAKGLGLDSFNSFSGLWGRGIVPGALVPGLGSNYDQSLVALSVRSQ